MMRHHCLLAAMFLVLFVAPDALAKYNPELGRFMQRDPIGYTGGKNLYGYTGANPVRYVDPLGLFRLNFDSSVSEAERARITKAINNACDSVRDANKSLDGVSQCAANRLGSDFDDARRKLKGLEKDCDSDQPLGISSGPGLAETYAITYDPSSPPLIWQPVIEFNTDMDGDPEADGTSRSTDLPAGAPGNSWHDDPTGPSAAEVAMHELLHYAELAENSRDRDNSGRHDDPMSLSDIAKSGGFNNSSLGKAVDAAEKCCGN